MTEAETVARPAYRPYQVSVVAVQRLSPHFVRVVFSGDDLEHFGTGGLDQRIKLFLPNIYGQISDFGQDDVESLGSGEWYSRWRALPVADRSPMRTYTVRRIDPTARELTVDFVVHHDAGPAGDWAENVTLGQEIIVVGPDQRSSDSLGGIDWHPGTARRVLIAGDETAAPAIASILESLGAEFNADVFIEVPTAADILSITTEATARVSWLVRGDRDHGAVLSDAVQAWSDESSSLLERAAAPRRQELDDINVDDEMLWDVPEDVHGEFYAWIAGESALVKGLRRLLVQGRGVDRKRVAFMGYWRLGQSERNE